MLPSPKGRPGSLHQQNAAEMIGAYVSFSACSFFRHGCMIQQLGVGGYVIGRGSRVGMEGKPVDLNAAGMAWF